jgi:hypothetical protein
VADGPGGHCAARDEKPHELARRRRRARSSPHQHQCNRPDQSQNAAYGQ